MSNDPKPIPSEPKAIPDPSEPPPKPPDGDPPPDGSEFKVDD